MPSNDGAPACGLVMARAVFCMSKVVVHVSAQIFKKYQAMMELKLERFLADENSSPEQLYRHCEELRVSGNSAWATCVDYLSSCLEYEPFSRLVADFVAMREWALDGEDEWDPPLEDDGGPPPEQS